VPRELFSFILPQMPVSEGFLTLMQLYNILQQQLTTTTPTSSAAATTSSTSTAAPSPSIQATFNFGNKINTTTTDGVDLGANISDIMITIGKAIALDMEANGDGISTRCFTTELDNSLDRRRKRSPQFDLSSLIPKIPNILPTANIPGLTGFNNLTQGIPGLSNLNISSFSLPGLQIPTVFDANSTSPIVKMIEGYITQYQQQAGQVHRQS
jgi:hypothetical protein